MATRVTLVTIGEQLLVSKVALTGDRRDRRAEAVWLAEAHHAGVVRLHRLIEDPVTIMTEHAGGETLRTRPCSPATAAGLLSQTCSTLATLHQRGLFHGNITLDHIIVDTTDLGASTRLCSPTGTADDPNDDLVALGRCVSQLLSRWDEAGTQVADRPVWDELAERLAQIHGPYGVQRAIGVLAGLSREAPSRGDDENGSGPAHQRSTAHRHRRLGAGVVATLACLSLAGFLAIRPQSTTTTDQVELTIGTSIYSTVSGTPLVVDRPCAETPAAVLLDEGTGAIWGFYDPADGSTASAMATVAGATGIEARTIHLNGMACDEVWVTGPAGETRLAS